MCSHTCFVNSRASASFAPLFLTAHDCFPPLVCNRTGMAASGWSLMLLLSAPGRQYNGGGRFESVLPPIEFGHADYQSTAHTHTHIHKIKHLSVFMQICFHPTRFDPTACQHNQWKESNLVSSLCHEAGTSR